MGDPELHSDEKILLTTQNVFVKSIPFEAVLTTKRIILIDRKKNLIPPKDILLATIRDFEAGENAIRDQVITLSLITSTGETRQLVLTFSRTAGGGRKRERDEWVKNLKELTSSPIQKAIRKVIPSFDQDQKKVPQEQVSPKIEISSRPAAKKEIEGAQPIKKIVETGTMPPKPVEESSLPSGSFCSRCGNRVPPESVFCNRCGSKITPPGQEPAAEPPVPQVQAEPPLPAVAVPPLERRERPIDKEIQSIEPLIEGSVPRTTESPPVPAAKPAEPPVTESPLAQAAQSIIDSAAASTLGEPATKQAPVPPVDATAAAPQETGQPRSILPQLFLKQDLPQQPPPAGAPVPPAPTGGSGPRRRTMFAIGVVLLIVVLVAAGVFLYWNSLSKTGGEGGSGIETTPLITPTHTLAPVKTPTTRPTPAPTVTTVQPTPTQVLIPPSGVWVRVTYPGTYTGSLGTAAVQNPVTGSGDKFYPVSTSEGIVQASIQKTDGSGDELTVEVYKNGALVKRGTTTIPKGTVEVQIDLKPPTPKPTTPAAAPLP